MRKIAFLCSCVVLSGCAHIEFSDNEKVANQVDDRLRFYYAKPQLVMMVAAPCAKTFTTVQIEDGTGYLKLVPGIGSNNLTAAMANGVLTNVGQNTDTKLADTASALSTVAKIIGVGAAAAVAPQHQTWSQTGDSEPPCDFPPGTYFIDKDGSSKKVH